MAQVTFHDVTSLPSTPVEGGLYFLTKGNNKQLYLATGTTSESYVLVSGGANVVPVGSNTTDIDSPNVTIKGIQAFQVNNDDEIYLGDPATYGIVSLSDVVYHITCFRGDTTYVTMYDGSKKLLKDVKIGDSVLGYDVNKKDYCEAVVLRNVKTGAEMGYDCYVTDDGTTIDVHGKDSFITRYEDSNNEEVISINEIKDIYTRYSNNQGKRYIIKDSGNTESATAVIHRFWAACSALTARYSIYTSNGTIFVNGLLHSQSPRDTICFLRKRGMNVPDNIKDIYNAIALDMADIDESLPDDHIEDPEASADLDTLNKAKAVIAWCKEQLSKTDYKAMKYEEGALTEEEWLPIKAKRQEYRDIINRKEQTVAEYTAKVAENNPALIYTGDTPKWVVDNIKWKERQAILDSHLDDFKAWVC